MTGPQRPSAEIDTRRLVIKAALATLFVLALLSLGIYAFTQGVVHGRIVYLVESFGALLLGGIGFNVMARFWIGYFSGKI